MPEDHQMMGGKLHVYRRENSSCWQCSTFLGGRNHRRSTKEESLSLAKDIAEDWYLELKGKFRAGELKNGKTFKFAADQFRREYETITAGERNAQYVDGHWRRLKVHLLPFFGEKVVSEITPGLVQEYRVHRATSRKHPKTGEPVRPARSTLHQEIVTLRHVLNTAQRHGWLPFVPNLSPPYRASGKIVHRAWFSPEEYKQLYEGTRQRASKPPKPRWKWACEQLHDFTLFMVNTGLRPDEAWRLEYRDVEIVDDEGSGETILEISVRGKRGVGYCKSMPGAVHPFERVRDRPKPNDMGRGQRSATKGDGKSRSSEKAPTDLLFPKRHRELFNEILSEKNLKKDREGNARTFYSLRHTYISMRLMEGADIYQIAKNCRTSVEMIEKFYASHIKNMIDASAVNVRKTRPNGGSSKRTVDTKRKKPARHDGDPEARD
ncbi:MAG: site-specific integrase [Burkholderiales bacterium]|nr:site-specific integrase [Burkholderiales bacterium]